MSARKSKKISLFFPILVLSFLGLSIFVLKQTFKNPACANSLSCRESLELSVNNEEVAVFNGQEIDPPDINLALEPEETDVLGTEDSVGTKRIEVDLTTQTLKAYEDDTLFIEARVSTGKFFPTPTGEFTIWKKIRSTKMSGGEGAGYYYLPNVPYVMFFSISEVAAGRGFSLHGTYWHNNFGHAMSHGCVNMRTIDIKKLFAWANPGKDGTKIIIYGKAS